MTEQQTIQISAEEKNKRLDKLLSERFQKSRNYFQDLMEKGKILLNGKKAKKSSKAEIGDRLDIFFLQKALPALKTEKIDLNILFEDEHIIVINKPASMVVHPAAGNWEHTLANGLLYHCQNIKLPKKEEYRPGIVHRLDKETSGVLITAKTEQAHTNLSAQFAKREIYKEYLAVTVGKTLSQTVEEPIGRAIKNRKKMAVRTDGKKARTDFQFLAFKDGLSLVSAILKTGRTHQIRVHLRFLNTPILGDSVYGFTKTNHLYRAGRPFLHAYKLGLLHPIFKTFLEFTAPPPEDIKNFIYQITRSVNF